MSIETQKKLTQPILSSKNIKMQVLLLKFAKRLAKCKTRWYNIEEFDSLLAKLILYGPWTKKFCIKLKGKR